MQRGLNLIVVAILCTLCLARDACADGRVRVGAILPLSGDLASFGEIVLKGLKQAKSNGIEVLTEDDACMPSRTVSAYRKLTEVDHVSYILGPICGSSQQTLAPLIKSSSRLVMLLGSGADNLYQLSGGRVFSPQYSNEDEARYNAAFLHGLGAKRVALIFYDDIFCRNHERAFRRSFPGEIAQTFAFSLFDVSAIKPIATRLKALKVEGIYVPDVTPFQLGLRREMNKLGMLNIPMVSIYSAQLENILNVEGTSADGLLYSYPAIGELNAVGYFPRRGAELLFETIRSCNKDTDCTRSSLMKSGQFDERGVLKGTIETRVISNGKFVKLATIQADPAVALPGR